MTLRRRDAMGGAWQGRRERSYPEDTGATEDEVLDVRARGPRRRGDVRMEDGELVALVLEEPVLGLGPELEAVRARGGVLGGEVALRPAVSQDDEAARFVRLLRARVFLEGRAHLGRNHHQTERSISASASGPVSQKPAERYFQPPSARIATTTPSSSSSASFRATCTTAPDETPAKIPSRSSSRRRPATASAFETSTFRSSRETSRIGGT